MTQQPDLTVVTAAVLADARARKRLRYVTALTKVGKQPTQGQVEVLVDDLVKHLEAHYLSLPDNIMADWMRELMGAAWSSGDAITNFALLRAARKS